MVRAAPLSVLYTIHYTKRHSACLGPDSKDRGVDLRAVVLIANMPRSIGGGRRRGPGGGIEFGFWILGCREFEIWPRARHTPTPAHFLWLVNIAKIWNGEKSIMSTSAFLMIMMLLLHCRNLTGCVNLKIQSLWWNSCLNDSLVCEKTKSFQCWW